MTQKWHDHPSQYVALLYIFTASVFSFSVYVMRTIVETSGITKKKKPLSTSIICSLGSTGERAQVKDFWDMGRNGTS